MFKLQSYPYQQTTIVKVSFYYKQEAIVNWFKGHKVQRGDIAWFDTLLFAKITHVLAILRFE
jgi:hypothetical protein